VIRLKGKNLTESEHVRLGSYHTLELEQQRAFTVHKDAWDALDVERVRQARFAFRRGVGGGGVACRLGAWRLGRDYGRRVTPHLVTGAAGAPTP
jgi:hypothetical protein